MSPFWLMVQVIAHRCVKLPRVDTRSGIRALSLRSIRIPAVLTLNTAVGDDRPADRPYAASSRPSDTLSRRVDRKASVPDAERGAITEAAVYPRTDPPGRYGDAIPEGPVDKRIIVAFLSLPGNEGFPVGSFAGIAAQVVQQVLGGNHRVNIAIDGVVEVDYGREELCKHLFSVPALHVEITLHREKPEEPFIPDDFYRAVPVERAVSHLRPAVNEIAVLREKDPQ